LVFNDKIDPATVSLTELSIIDITSGATPPVEFSVSGNQIIVRPTLFETEAGLTFGFEEDGIYRIQLFADPFTNVIRSVIGRPNITTLDCNIATSGITDLVPGRPQVIFTPDASTPPTSSDFVVTMVFTDLMQKAQLVNSPYGTSPTIGVQIIDDTQSSTIAVNVPGTFDVNFDQDALTTTLVFTPLSPFPGGRDGLRRLKLNFSTQIADIAGNSITNPGSYEIDLPNAATVVDSFTEGFNDLAMYDEGGSGVSMWAASPGAVSSNLDPLTGSHSGGGPGYLGSFVPTSDFTFDTDGMTLESVTGDFLNITDGVFAFDSIHIPEGVRVTAIGSNPLRLFSRGEFLVEGDLDLGGLSAPANFGKYYPRETEIIVGESTGGIFEFEAEGGDPGVGQCGAGSGGQGGMAWYLLDGPGSPANPNYLDENLNGFASGNGDPARYTDNIRWGDVHGANGDGIGGIASSGNPEANPTGIVTDRNNGAGMGSWAWPPVSNTVPSAAEMLNPPPTVVAGMAIESHFDSGAGLFENHALHRSRGGGGGGFWSDGSQGGFFDATSTNPLGDPLTAPVIDAGNNIWEYNDFLDWDHQSGGGVLDADGGQYSLPLGIETLDPNTGLLVGGSGGGGAGSSLHGSWSDQPTLVAGFIDTYRNAAGAGGGAGGGALQIHSGGRLSITGEVSVVGGAGGDSEFMLQIPYSDPAAINSGLPGDAGGGGGAGGGILIQTSGSLQLGADVFQLDGGRGGIGSAGNHGGAGGAGLIRFETATGGESLALLQSSVAPDSSVELAPIGQPGVANLIQNLGVLSGTTADAGIFNGNSAGVRSTWFAPANNVLLLDYTGYTITCRYNTGVGGDQFLVYESGNIHTIPGTTPVWAGFQVGWGSPGQSEPDAISITDWIIPGVAATGDGLTGLRSSLGRMMRFMLVFDQDQVAALIGADPAAFFEVQSINFDWIGE